MFDYLQPLWEFSKCLFQRGRVSRRARGKVQLLTQLPSAGTHPGRLWGAVTIIGVCTLMGTRAQTFPSCLHRVLYHLHPACGHGLGPRVVPRQALGMWPPCCSAGDHQMLHSRAQPACLLGSGRVCPPGPGGQGARMRLGLQRPGFCLSYRLGCTVML